MSKHDKQEGILPPRDQKRLDQDPERKPRAKKNTKRWCKGKVGREHVPEVVINPMWGNPNCGESSWWPGRWSCHHMRACKNCGKRIQWALRVTECPTWKEQAR